MSNISISIEKLTYKAKLKDGIKTILKPVSLNLHAGEIHTILGEKNSGKSIISSILKGSIKASTGIIRISGKKLRNLSIKESRKNGIEVVDDNNFLIDGISVGEQFFIYTQVKEKSRFFDSHSFNKKINAFLKTHETEFNSETEIRSLNESEKILLEILISIFCSPIFLILDEALSKLSTTDWNKVITALKKLSDDGCIILLLINHIDYIPTITTNLSILRNGELILTDSYGNLDKYNLIKILYSHVLNSNHSITTNKDFYNMIKYNQAILIDLPVVLIAVDSGFHIKFINLYAEQYFQTKTSKMINRPLRALITMPEQNERLIRDKTKATNSFKTQVFFNGIKRIANITSFSIEESSQSIGNILILTDTTEEESLRDHIIQNEKLASVGMLAAGVAHEINHPLGIIKNIIEIMKFNCQDSSLTADVETIENEIKIISQIISNLMGFSSEESAPLEVFDITDVILRVVQLLTFYAEKNLIKIIFDHKESIFEIYANKTDIRQVFLNLIKNAIEAMPDGGILRISIDYLDNSGDFVQIIFQDTGIGIKTENIEDIFLPFYSSKKNQSQNMGMGLYVSYNTIKKHKGEITVKSLPKEGTKFTIVFPLVK